MKLENIIDHGPFLKQTKDLKVMTRPAITTDDIKKIYFFYKKNDKN
jgi:hypothetical protein